MNDNQSSKKSDQVLVLDALPSGDLAAVRIRNGQAQLGTISVAGSGLGEPINLSPHGDHPDLFDVTPRVSSSHGPAKVNSSAFRSGWDSIFGQKSGAVLN